MEREFKSLPFASLKDAKSGRIRGGIAAVTGNIDSAGDRITAGAFTKTLAESGKSRVRCLWNHSWQHPPIASIKELREVGRSELPDAVLEKSPEATGGLLVKYEFFETDLSNWVMQAIDSGDINEMSFGYETILSEYITEKTAGGKDERQIRELKELRLLDVSPVLWGCNAATVAAGVKSMDVPPLGVIAANLASFLAEIKAGRRNADSDQKLIELIHSTACDLGAVCNPDTESDESNAGKAGAVPAGHTPLAQSWLKTRELDLNF
mgnify:CR=1 FL=1